MKILLVYPNLMGMNTLPPAMGLFTSILKAAGHQVALFDTTSHAGLGTGFDSDKLKEQNLNARPYDDSLLRRYDRHSSAEEDFARQVREFGPGLIAVSATEDMFPIALQLLGALPKDRPPVVLGGVFATFAPELALRLSEGRIDYVLSGEGEEALPELARCLERGTDVASVAGLSMRRGSGLIRNPLPRPVHTDSLPLPDYGLFEDARFYRPMQGQLRRMLPVETFRGCPYTCAYCNSPSQMAAQRHEGGGFFRMKSIAKVREEIAHVVRTYRADSLYFWADTFLAYNDRDFDAFCEMYSEFKLPFWMQTRPETVTEEKFRRLRDVGLLRVSFGIEHGNEEFRVKHLRRRVSNAQILERLSIPRKLGIPFSVNNIIGFPEETRALAFDTVELNRGIPSDGINAYSYTPFHGTPLREAAERLGLIHPDAVVRSLTQPTVLDMPQFPAAQIEGLRRCFVLYVKMPKERWPEIERAERRTPEADALWSRLRDECNDRYMRYGDRAQEDDAPPPAAGRAV